MNWAGFTVRDFGGGRCAGVCYNAVMPNKPPHPGRKGNAVSLAPLTPDQALAGLLRVKPADVAKERAKKKGKAKGNK